MRCVTEEELRSPQASVEKLNKNLLLGLNDFNKKFKEHNRNNLEVAPDRREYCFPVPAPGAV